MNNRQFVQCMETIIKKQSGSHVAGDDLALGIQVGMKMALDTFFNSGRVAKNLNDEMNHLIEEKV